MGGGRTGAVGLPEHVHHGTGHEHEAAHRVDDHGKSADADAPIRQQERRQHERARVTEQHQDAQSKIDASDPEILMPSLRVETTHRASVPLHQTKPGSEDPRLLEVLAIHQTALQVLKLSEHRHRLSLKPIVATAANDMTRNAGQKGEGNDQGKQGRERIEIDRCARE